MDWAAPGRVTVAGGFGLTVLTARSRQPAQPLSERVFMCLYRAGRRGIVREAEGSKRCYPEGPRKGPGQNAENRTFANVEAGGSSPLTSTRSEVINENRRPQNRGLRHLTAFSFDPAFSASFPKRKRPVRTMGQGRCE